MNLTWNKEPQPIWDEKKQQIIGSAAEYVFARSYANIELGSRIGEEWWQVCAEDRVVAYGWLDVVWGDAEVLFACDPPMQGRGIGRFIVNQLDSECRSRNLNYMYNTVNPLHPEGERLSAWLVALGFEESTDGRLSRAVARD